MASRKIKHARALAKREKFLEEERQRGLEAQRKGREEEAKRKAAKQARLEREEQEAADKARQDDLVKLIAMMSASMRRFPTDKEVHEFITGDETTRETILNNEHEGIAANS